MSRMRDILEKARQRAQAGDVGIAPSELPGAGSQPPTGLASLPPSELSTPPQATAVTTEPKPEPSPAPSAAAPLEELPELVNTSDPLALLDAVDEALAGEHLPLADTAASTDPLDPLAAYRAEASANYSDATSHSPPSPAAESVVFEPIHSGVFHEAYAPEPASAPSRSSEPPTGVAESAAAVSTPGGVAEPGIVRAAPRRSAVDRRAGSRPQPGAKKGQDRRSFSLRPGSPQREELAQMAARVAEAASRISAKTLLFTSPGRRDAKTSLVVQLAVALADRSQGPVLLIDADLRESVIGRIFALDGFRGVADVVMGWAEWTDVIRLTEIERLAIVPSGSAVPIRYDLLTEVDWAHLFSQVAERYRWVLVDAPQAIEPEVSALAAGCDAALLVVRLEHSDRYLAEESLTRLQESGTPVLGTLLTQTPAPIKVGR